MSSEEAAPATSEAATATFEVNVKCIDGSTTKLEVRSDLSGAELKELISKKLEVPPEKQRLIFRGRVFKDDDVVGSHITENGQTLHMVQRPGGPEGTTGDGAGGSSSSTTGPAAGPAAAQTPTGGPQVHFQFATMPNVGQQDLGQLLGSLFSSAGFAANGGQLQQPAAAGGGAAPGEGAAPGAMPPMGMPMPPPPTLPPDFSQLLRAMGTQAPAGFGGPPLPGGGAATAGNQMQIVFQQGLGHLAHMLPTMLGQDLGAADRMDGQPETQDAGASAGNGSDALPWRDLRRLHSHLSRALGRSSQHRPTLPPAHAPQGDLVAFLSLLLAANSQLGVAISDLQTSLSEGARPTPRQRLQFTMVLAAAARTFRALSTAMMAQNGGSGGLQSEPSPEASDAVAEASDAVERAQEEALEREAEAEGEAERPSEAEEGEDADDPREGSAPAAPAALSLGSASQGLSGQPTFHPSPREVASDRNDDSLEEPAFEDAEDREVQAERGRPDQLAMPTATEAAEMMRMLPNYFGSGAQGAEAGTAAEDPLADLPPEVRACWQRWIQPDSFARVIGQALQPPFSRAYLSGDSTGSHHTPVLPPPEEFLPLRWQRAAGRVEGLREIPEPPEHLSRAYLSAFMRDMGQFAASSATYASIPEAAERYPHLAQLVAFVGRQGEAAHRESEPGGT